MNFENQVTDQIPEYLGSEYYFMLEDACKEYMEQFLIHLFMEAQKHDDFPDAWSRHQLQTGLKNMAKLLPHPLEIKKAYPYMLGEFLDYLINTARPFKADLWLSWLNDYNQEYQNSFREDGTIKGDSVKFDVKKVKRNDPCPCGSGKKFKKCCGTNV